MSSGNMPRRWALYPAASNPLRSPYSDVLAPPTRPWAGPGETFPTLTGHWSGREGPGHGFLSGFARLWSWAPGDIGVESAYAAFVQVDRFYDALSDLKKCIELVVAALSPAMGSRMPSIQYGTEY
jgi:hypothetical protein